MSRPADAESDRNQADVHKGDIDFESGGYKDVPFAIAFVLHLGVMAFIAFSNKDNVDFSDDSSSSGTDSRGEKVSSKVLYGIIAGLIASVVFGLVWMNVLKRISGSIIKFMIFANIFGLILLGFFSLAVNPIGAFIFWLFAALSAVYYYFIRRRIQFTSVMLEISIECIKTYGASIYVALGLQIVSIFWLVLWSFAAVGASSTNSGSGDSQVNSGVLFLLFVSLFWTMYVIANVAHVTVAGVAATWYFTTEARQVTSASFKRATTTSFGSICMGSLIVSIISALRAMVNLARDQDDSCIKCIVECILSCIESIAQFISKYAYTYVAIYGDGFVPAAKKTWQLLMNRGWDVLVNDDLSGLALGFSAALGGVVSAIVGGLVALTLDVNDTSKIVTIIACFFLGFFIVSIIMSVLDSCVATFFVLWAEAPQALQQNHQRLYLKLTDAVRTAYPGLQI